MAPAGSQSLPRAPSRRTTSLTGHFIHFTSCSDPEDVYARYDPFFGFGRVDEIRIGASYPLPRGPGWQIIVEQHLRTGERATRRRHPARSDRHVTVDRVTVRGAVHDGNRRSGGRAVSRTFRGRGADDRKVGDILVASDAVTSRLPVTSIGRTLVEFAPPPLDD